MSSKDFFLREWPGVADGWKKWGPTLSAQSAGATDSIIDLAQVRPGMVVLDLASGVGDPALEVARRVGPAGRVVATDFVPGPLSVLDQAARSAGLPWLTSEVADMAALPFADATFNAVTCRLGIMFCTEPEQALAEVRRVLKPGARAAFLVWGSPSQPLFESTLSVVAECLPSELEAEPPADLPGPFSFAAAGSLSSQLERVGFSAVHEELKQIPWPFRGTPAQFWEMFSDLAGPSFREALRGVPQDELLERISQKLAPYRRGPVIDPSAWLIGCSANRPSL